jgi:hypothetical protein
VDAVACWAIDADRVLLSQHGFIRNYLNALCRAMRAVLKIDHRSPSLQPVLKSLSVIEVRMSALLGSSSIRTVNFRAT